MLKSDVRSFWDQGSAGEFWAVGSDSKARFVAEERSRYQFEPFIPHFADFAAAADRVVLEIGVGMGATISSGRRPARDVCLAPT